MQNVHDNIQGKDRAWLEVVYAEWLGSERDPGPDLTIAQVNFFDTMLEDDTALTLLAACEVFDVPGVDTDLVIDWCHGDSAVHDDETVAAFRASIEALRKKYGDEKSLDDLLDAHKAATEPSFDEPDLDQKKYEAALEQAKTLPDETLADFIWEKTEQLAECENGGHDAFCCPFHCGCHTVSFSREEDEDDDEDLEEDWDEEDTDGEEDQD
jgi:hypothetical protein